MPQWRVTIQKGDSLTNTVLRHKFASLVISVELMKPGQLVCMRVLLYGYAERSNLPELR